MRYAKPLILALLVAAMLLLGASLCGAQQPTTYVPNMALPLLRNLQHWWKGLPGRTGGLTMYDLVPGSLDHGTLTNMGFSSTSGWSPSTRPGGGWQVNFDGTDDYVDTTVNAGLTVSSPFTLCAWVNAGATAGSAVTSIIDNLQPSNYGGIVLRFGEVHTRPELMIANEGISAYTQVIASANLATQTWTHLCGTYDGSQTSAGLALYAQGAVLPSSTVNNTWGAFTDRPWRIGAGRNPTASELFVGAIESVMVFTRALPLAEIQALYQAGLQGDAPLFVSPMAVIAAPVGGPPGSFFPFFR